MTVRGGVTIQGRKGDTVAGLEGDTEGGMTIQGVPIRVCNLYDENHEHTYTSRVKCESISTRKRLCVCVYTSHNTIFYDMFYKGG